MEVVVAVIIILFLALAVFCGSLMIRLGDTTPYIDGDQWNHKGTLHIFKDGDDIYTQLELHNNNSLHEIMQNNQVIFDVRVHEYDNSR